METMPKKNVISHLTGQDYFRHLTRIVVSHIATPSYCSSGDSCGWGKAPPELEPLEMII